MAGSISGLWVALVTPLDARHLLSAGWDGVVPFG
jgi:hypothetical protein